MKKIALIIFLFSFVLTSKLVASVAPVTFAPVIKMSASGPVSIPITVNGFTDIGAITLSLEYDPAIITYQNTYTKNAAFGSSFEVGDLPIQGESNKRIFIFWYGTGVSLANGSTLCTLNFTYSTVNGTTTGLTWYDNGPSCEYADVYGYPLLDTPTADYYKNGAVTPPLSVNFSASNLTPPKNTTVTFTDLTTGGATSWDWSFDRTTVSYVNPTNSHSKNPQVQFTDGGLYTVKLVAHTSYIADSVTKTGYIRAGIAGTWTGKTSADWNTLSNWDDYLLPISSTDVIIPASALNWPVFNGNLILGTNCRNLTLIGQSSKMTITGSLSIQ